MSNVVVGKPVKLRVPYDTSTMHDECDPLKAPSHALGSPRHCADSKQNQTDSKRTPSMRQRMYFPKSYRRYGRYRHIQGVENHHILESMIPNSLHHNQSSEYCQDLPHSFHECSSPNSLSIASCSPLKELALRGRNSLYTA